MQPETAAALVELNRAFYTQTAASFAETRRRLQPGVLRILSDLPDPPGCTWLDLGCGPGTLARHWLETRRASRYLGLDFSNEFLAAASQQVDGWQPPAEPGQPPHAGFRMVDLAEPLRDADTFGPLCGALCFATLHHLPSAPARARLVRQTSALLPPGGQMAVSVWQFQHSPRLRERVQPWQAAGLREEDVDPGDYLLDWRADPARPAALRYVHLFSEQELAGLAAQAGMDVLESFYSDGEGGRLGLYARWQKPF